MSKWLILLQNVHSRCFEWTELQFRAMSVTEAINTEIKPSLSQEVDAILRARRIQIQYTNY